MRARYCHQVETRCRDGQNQMEGQIFATCAENYRILICLEEFDIILSNVKTKNIFPNHKQYFSFKSTKVCLKWCNLKVMRKKNIRLYKHQFISNTVQQRKNKIAMLNIPTQLQTSEVIIFYNNRQFTFLKINQSHWN